MRALQHSVYPISNLDDLNDRLRTCWENLDQQITDKSIDQLRDRLKAVQTEGCGSSEWWAQGTVVLIIWFTCCRADIVQRMRF